MRALRWPRWRWRRAAPEHADLPPDRLPDLPAAALAHSADELAAQGRYREAVRERLRAIVRDLVERDVITHRPGWTVTELAVAAGRARPATAAALAAASEIFSGIWYGQRPADAWQDAAMRDLAARVRAGLEQRVGV
jgi:D-serine deaminase-like pyridoxal phosphate-dependent protein